MANLISKLVGWILLLVGIAGFFAPQLSPARNLVHILTGGVSLWCGMGPVRAARTSCVLFGAAYGLLGAAGFAFGEPGVLELGTMDHVIHVGLGVVYLAAALVTRPLAAAHAPR